MVGRPPPHGVDVSGSPVRSAVGWGGTPGVPEARILVAQSYAGPHAASPASALESFATGLAFEQPAAIETAASLSECIDLARHRRFDLLVVDELLGGEAEEIVARLRRGAAAIIVLQRGVSDASALAWFRRGAAECVVADRDF